MRGFGLKKLSAVAICLLIVLVITVKPSFAQEKAPEFGVMAGLNFANFSWDIPDDSFETVSAIKFGVGGILLYPLSEFLELQVEVMYLQKGAKLDMFEGFKVDKKWKFAYLSVPVLGRYNLGSGDASTYVVAGPELGYLLSAEVETSEGSEDVKDELKSIEFGISVGTGVSMNMGSTPMFGEVRYSMGLSDMDDSSDDDSSVKSRGIQLFVGMMF